MKTWSRLGSFPIAPSSSHGEEGGPKLHSHWKGRVLSLVAWQLLGFPFLQEIEAQTVYTWDAGGADAELTTFENWAGAAPDLDFANGILSFGTAGAFAYFPNTSSGGGTVFLPDTTDSYSVTGFAFTRNFTILKSMVGDEFRVGSSGISVNASVAATVDANVRLNANQSWVVGSGGSLSVLNLSGTRNLTISGGGVARVTGTNSSTGSLTVANGTWRIANLGQFGSPSAISLGSSGAKGTIEKTGTSAVVMTNAATLVSGGTGSLLASGGTLTWSGELGGAGSLQAQAGSGAVLAISGSNSYAGSTTISGSGVTRISGGAAITDASAVTIDNAATLELLANETVGSLGGSGSMLLNGNLLTVGGAQSGTFSGVISGAGGISRTGVGTLTLQGANTYSGTTVVNGGEVAVSHASALGGTAGGTVVSSGATLDVSGNISVLGEALSLSGTGSAGQGALRNSSGNNVYGGLITLAANATISSTSGTLQLDVTSGQNVVGNFDLTIDGAGDVRINDGISLGGGGLAKSGAGSLWLSSSNAYTGTTSVQAGTLRVLDNGALGSGTAGTSVVSGAAVEMMGNLQVGESFVLAGSGILQGGALRSVSGTSTLSGALVLAGDAWIASDAGTLTLDVASGNAVSGDATLTVGGAGNVVVLDALALGSGGLRKEGAGTLVLRGSNSYTGQTVINGGVVSVENANAIGSGTAGTSTTVASGGALQLSGGLTVAGELLALSGSGAAGNGALVNVSGTNSWTGAVTLNSAASIGADAGHLTIDVAGGNAVSGTSTLTLKGAGTIVLADSVSLGGGNLVKDGSGLVVLQGDNTFANTTVTSGTLQVGNNGGSGSLGTGDVINNGVISFFRTGTFTQAGNISGSGSVLKRTSGTLTLSGNNSFSGSTAVIGGNLRVTSDTGLGNTTGATFVTDGATLELAGGIEIGAEALTIGGGGVSGGGALRSTSGTNTFGGQITLTSNVRINTTAGVLILDTASGNAVTGNFDITFGGSFDTRVLDPLSLGTAAIVKNGTGAVWLAANNSYSGNTTVNAGVLRLLADNALGATSGSTSVVSGASLEFQGGITVAEAISVAGAGVSSAGAIRNISGTNTISTGVTLTGASLISSDAGVLVLDVASGEAIHGTQHLRVGGAGGVEIADAIGIGAASLIKEGTGTLRLSGSSSYSGDTTVSAGQLRIANGNALGTAAGWTSVANGASLVIEGSFSTPLFLAEEIYLAGNGINSGGALRHTDGFTRTTGAISLTGNARISSDAGLLIVDVASGASVTGNYSLTVSGGGDVLFSDGVSLGASSLTKEGAGLLTLYGTNTFGNAVISSGVLRFGDGFVTTTTGSGSILNNSALLIHAAGDVTASNVISGSGSFEKGGDGRLIVSGSNSYDGQTLVGQGTLRIAHANALGSTAGGTEVDFGSALEISGGITVAGEALSLDGNGVGNGGVFRNVSGSNAYRGSIALAGDARINSDSGLLRLGVAGAPAITGNHALVFGGSGNIEVVGAIVTGTSGVVKDGAGTLIFGGSNTYTGDTTVSNGDLVVNGSIQGDVIVQAGGALGGSGVIGGNVTVEGLLSPGNSPGQLTLLNDLTLQEGALLEIQIAGITSGLYDQLDVQGVFTADGTLNLMLIDGYVPLFGSSFVIFNGATPGFEAGEFTLTTNLGGGLSWDTTDLASDGIVRVVPEPSTWILLGSGLLWILAFRRRRAAS